MSQETKPAASPAAPTAVIPGAHSSVNLGPDYDRGVLVWRGPDFETCPENRVIFSDIRSYAPPDLNLDTPAKPRVLWTGTDGRVNDLAVEAL